MLTLELSGGLLAWHATSATNLAMIPQQGLRRMNKGVSIGLHPGVALGYARAHVPDALLITLTVTEPQRRWGGDLHLDRHEGSLWTDLPPEAIHDIRPVSSCSGIPSCWLAHEGLHPGFAPYLDDDRTAEHLGRCLEGAAQDPATALIAALYAPGLDEARLSVLVSRMPPAMEQVLRQAPLLPLEMVQCALEVLYAADRNWSPKEKLLSLWPLPVVALWASTRLDGDDWLPPPISDRIRVALGGRVADQVRQVLSIPSGQAPAVLDLAQAEALVAVCRFARIGCSRQRSIRSCLDGLAVLAEPLADQALLTLLADLRRLPVKAREHLFHLLVPRAGRLAPALQTLADTAPWITARMARRLLDPAMRSTDLPEEGDA